jgi:hypothetical protein
MKKVLCCLPVSLVLVLLLFPAVLLSTERGIAGIRVSNEQVEDLYLYKDYQALVMGVSDYEKWPKLPNAGADAREVAEELKSLGFEVTLQQDPGYEQMRAALKTMVHDMGSEKERGLVFYFAGHGETLDLADGTKLGYIIPRDCPMKSEDPLAFDSMAISMKEVETLALQVKSKHVLMLFDSCFSGALFSMSRAAPVAISEKSAKPVRQFITAGGAGEQVPDQSVFKTVFLQGIKGEADLNEDKYVTASELGMHLHDKVVTYSNGGQHPQYGKINNPKLDKGDFIFAPPSEIGRGQITQLPRPPLPQPPRPPSPDPVSNTPKLAGIWKSSSGITIKVSQQGNQYAVVGGESSGRGTINGTSITMSVQRPQGTVTGRGIIKKIGAGNVAHEVEWPEHKLTWTRSPDQNIPPTPNLAGQWVSTDSRMSPHREIRQRGDKFTLVGPNWQTECVLHGYKITIHGRPETGRVAQVTPENIARRIEWSDGSVYTRR